MGTGPEPFFIEAGDTPIYKLANRLCEAKESGCIAVVVEMVSGTNGKVISPSFFIALQKSCLEIKLFLIIDEALTAIRCGAPFSFQRNEYTREHTENGGPDLVFFGKGIGLCGFAVNFDGQLMARTGFKTEEHKKLMTTFWRGLVSQAVQLPLLIEAKDILASARSEDWPARSRRIGRVLRSLVWEAESRSGFASTERRAIRGLDALILIERDRALKFPVNGTMLKRSKWARWLPKLDQSMTEAHLVKRYIFSPEGVDNRLRKSQAAISCGTMPLWCFVCSAPASDPAWCKTCFLSSCTQDVCKEAFCKHPCFGRCSQPKGRL